MYVFLQKKSFFYKHFVFLSTNDIVAASNLVSSELPEASTLPNSGTPENVTRSLLHRKTSSKSHLKSSNSAATISQNNQYPNKQLLNDETSFNDTSDGLDSDSVQEDPTSTSLNSQQNKAFPLNSITNSVAGLNIPSSNPSPKLKNKNLTSSPSTNSKGGFFSKFRRSNTVSISNAEQDKKEEYEPYKHRDEGWNAGVFGFVPNFPTPPKYIWVHAHKKRNREFTRMFLAQELGENSKPSKNRQRSSSVDSSSQFSINSSPSKSGNMDNNTKKKAIWAAKFSPDGKYLATAGADSIIKIWKVLSDTKDRELFEREMASTNSDDEYEFPHLHHPPTLQHTLSTSSQTSKSTRRSSLRINRKKKIVSAPVFLPKPIIEFKGHTQDILDLCWSKNNFLLSSSMDKTVKLWHVQFTDCIKTFPHFDFVTSIAFHPTDDRFFISGSLDCRVRLWSITESRIEYERDAPDFVMSVTFTPDGTTAVAGCFGGQCLFFDTEELRLKSQMIVKSSHGRNSKGSRITGIQIIDMPIRQPSFKTQPTSTPSQTIAQEAIKRTSIERKMLVSTSDSRIRLYNFSDRTLEAKYKGHTAFQGQIHSSFSDSGTYIISGSEDEKTYIWRTKPESGDASKKRESYEYFHSNKSIVTISLFAPNTTRRLLYNSRDPIYDIAIPPPVILKSDSSIKSNSSTHESASSYKVDPLDGNIIITCDQDGVIKVFRQDSAYERRKQQQETANLIQKKKISGVALSPSQSSKDGITYVGTSRGPSLMSSSSSQQFNYPRASSSSRPRYEEYLNNGTNINKEAPKLTHSVSFDRSNSMLSNYSYGSSSNGYNGLPVSPNLRANGMDDTRSSLYSNDRRLPQHHQTGVSSQSIRRIPPQSNISPSLSPTRTSRSQSLRSPFNRSESISSTSSEDSFDPRKVVAQALNGYSINNSPKSNNISPYQRTSQSPLSKNLRNSSTQRSSTSSVSPTPATPSTAMLNSGLPSQSAVTVVGHEQGSSKDNGTSSSLDTEENSFMKCSYCGSTEFKVKPSSTGRPSILCVKCCQSY